jgi:7-carboxy-7-deazaguanine synthase
VTYRVNDVYPTIQGEGCLTGVPMVLVRLQGCGVGCPWCDTKETWAVDPAHCLTGLSDVLGTNPQWAEVEPAAVAALARRVAPALDWVLVTGGEPAEQPLGPLVAALKSAGFRVALETSGTAGGSLGVPFDWVCVSPKLGMPGGRAVRSDVIGMADEVKMVIGKSADVDALNALLDRIPIKPGCQVCLQPLSQSEKATRLCLETAMRRGWRLSLQSHKSLGVR